MSERSERTIAWFHCFSGVAGDMALGALLDAGADLDGVRATVRGLGVDGWALDVARVERGGIAATRAVVEAPEGHHHRTWSTIRGLLEAATLPDRVRARSLAAFAALADAEGRIHGVAPDDVHFHEVGALDAIVDVVGTCAALESLGVDDVRCSAIATGSGTVTAAHGVLPVPAPATMRLLEGVPVLGVDVAMELATPTGAALMRTLAGVDGFGAMPAMVVRSSGYGAGGRDLPGRPNVVQVVVGEAASGRAGAEAQPDALLLLETNVDDVTGEVLAHAVEALLAAGARDAWATPIVMKKGRPAHTVHALVEPGVAGELRRVLGAETGSLGVRATAVERWPLDRELDEVTVGGHRIRVKRTPDGRAKVEFDDAAAAAAALGVPVREVLVRAEATALDAD